MKITFNPVDPGVAATVTPPKPAREYLPEWYKKMPAFEDNKVVINERGQANKTVKLCMPFLDGSTAGYIQELWQDIYIDIKEIDGKTGFRYAQPTLPEAIGIRDSPPAVQLDDSFYPFEFTLHPVWAPKMPKGWSMLYTHPQNRFDLPFHFTSGIVDADGFSESLPRSNFPFYIKKGFSGVIPKGTPMYQMIPFKREDWESEAVEFDVKRQMSVLAPVVSKFWGGYKNSYWNKKTYK